MVGHIHKHCGKLGQLNRGKMSLGRMLKYLQYAYRTAGMEPTSRYVFISKLILLAREYIFISLYCAFLFFLTTNLMALYFNYSTYIMYT
jgi:hypothetical protein